jgi:uncharacterized protein involved in exopolysaccharide biosynthesis/MinD-like ATPase involved in chromosome partitioning or flagellar assembly
MATPSAEQHQPAMVGNPLLTQIRDFIDTDEAVPALDPVGIVLRALRGRERNVAALVLVVAMLAGLCGWLIISPAYQSAGMVRVLAREAKLLYADSDDSRLRLYDAFVTAEMQLMQSRPVLDGALSDLYTQGDRLAAVPGDVGDLASMLSVANKKGLVTVAARSGDPALSAAAVNAVLTSYESSNEAARRRQYDVRRQELSAREQDLEATLAALNARFLEVGGEHDVGTLSKAHVAKTAQLEVLEERIAKLGNTIAQMQATGGVGADVGSIEIQRATLLDKAMADMTYERARRMAALETLKRRYRPSHPLLRGAQLELATLESALAERRQQIATLGKAGALTGSAADSTRQSVVELETVRSNLVNRRETIRAEASDLNTKLIHIRSIATEQSRVNKLLEETKRALDEVLVESHNDLSRSVEIVARGKIPDRPIEDKRKPAALGAAVFGGLGTLAFVIGGTLLAGRIRFSDDLDAAATAALAAVVPDSPDGPSVERQPLESAALKLRNELDLRWPGPAEPPLVIGVVAVSAGAGATSISQALGTIYAAGNRKVLLIDAAPSDRGLSRLDGADDTAELPDVNEGGLAAIDPTAQDEPGVGVLNLVAAGPAAPDTGQEFGAELTVEDMQRLLAGAADSHDVIIVDLGVLAAGRQSAVGAALADRVLLVAAGSEKKRRVTAALNLLERLAPQRFLLMLNRAAVNDPQLACTEVDGAATTRLAEHWLSNLSRT